MKIPVALCSVLVSILCAQSACAAPVSSQMKTILVLGDSLSGGFGLKPGEAYPALLPNKLRAAGLNFQVTNASQSRGPHEGGPVRFQGHLKRTIAIVRQE